MAKDFHMLGFVNESGHRLIKLHFHVELKIYIGKNCQMRIAQYLINILYFYLI